MSESWLDELNPAQREAVAHREGPLLVVAGAGSGKTKTLACRVAYLISQGVSAEQILLLTFTRRASAEMIRRAEGLTSESSAGRVWGGTFHAVANRLLRIYGSGIGLGGDFTVMDQTDAEDLMNLIRGEMGVARTRRRFARKHTLLAIYSRTVSSGEKLGDVVRRHFPWCQEDVSEIREMFKRYTDRKGEQNVLDYDDLLLMWNELCRAPGVGDSVADRFEHVLVDEYQDTNQVQSEILRGMRRNKKNIMAVGDDAQSIYSFRSASVRNILDFPEHFPGTRIVTLEQNYRSTKPILDASNAVMEDAKDRYTKNLWSSRESVERPALVTCFDEPEQSKTVCRNILEHLEQGVSLQRQAVLFRAGHHSDHLEVELSRRKIPFHKFGGLKFIEASHVKDLLAFLRILENPHDELSWYRVLQLLEGVGPKAAQRIMGALGVRRAPSASGADVESNGVRAVSPLAILMKGVPQVAPASARGALAEMRLAMGHCLGVDPGRAEGLEEKGNRAEPPPASQVERIRGFYEPIFHAAYENAAMRVRDLEQLEQIAGGYRSRSSFVTDLTLDPPASTADLAGPPYLEEDYLVLSTIHSAKGCEWDVVHVIHAADGMMPSDMALSDEEGVDEERRLFYVAMTRAKDHLYVYFPLRYYHRKHAMGDSHSYAQLTRFITKEVRKLFAETAGEGARAAKAGLDRSRDVRERLKSSWDN